MRDFNSGEGNVTRLPHCKPASRRLEMVVEEMNNEITLTLPLGMELEGLDLGRNFSALYGEGVQAGESADPVAYEQFLADVWIGIVLTLMVLSCVCCMCSCLLYHKFQQWKRNGM